MFGDGSVMSFLERVNPPPEKRKGVQGGWLQMRRDYAVRLRDDGRIFVLHPHSFPWRKADRYGCVGEVLEWGREEEKDGGSNEEYGTKTATKKVGPCWTVLVRALTPPALDETEARKLLARPAIPSWDDFMEGRIVYHLRGPSSTDAQSKVHIRPLVLLSEFRRETRPESWKNSLDLRLEGTLPLPGLDDEAQGVLDGIDSARTGEYGKDWCVVRVELALECV